jgi:hypothetical protein
VCAKKYLYEDIILLFEQLYSAIIFSMMTSEQQRRRLFNLREPDHIQQENFGTECAYTVGSLGTINPGQYPIAEHVGGMNNSTTDEITATLLTEPPIVIPEENVQPANTFNYERYFNCLCSSSDNHNSRVGTNVQELFQLLEIVQEMERLPILTSAAQRLQFEIQNFLHA